MFEGNTEAAATAVSVLLNRGLYDGLMIDKGDQSVCPRLRTICISVMNGVVIVASTRDIK